MKKLETDIQNSLIKMGSMVNVRPEFKRAAKLRILGETQSKINYYPKFAGAFFGVLALLVFGGGTVFAAQYSLPGSKLYPVKILSEKVAVAVVPKSIKPAVQNSISERRATEENLVNKKTDQVNNNATNKNSEAVKQLPEKVVEETSSQKTEVIQNVIKDAPTEIIQTVTSKENVIKNAGEVIKSNSIKLPTVTK